MKNPPFLILSHIIHGSRYKVNGQIPKNGRGPVKRPFPYNGPKELLSLKNNVANRLSTKGDSACIDEMSALLTCLKENNFNENVCLKQSNMLKSCWEQSRVTRAQKEKEQKSEIPIPGSKTLTSQQLNYLLKKYPQPLDKY